MHVPHGGRMVHKCISYTIYACGYAIFFSLCSHSAFSRCLSLSELYCSAVAGCLTRTGITMWGTRGGGCTAVHCLSLRAPCEWITQRLPVAPTAASVTIIVANNARIVGCTATASCRQQQRGAPLTLALWGGGNCYWFVPSHRQFDPFLPLLPTTVASAPCRYKDWAACTSCTVRQS